MASRDGEKDGGELLLSGALRLLFWGPATFVVLFLPWFEVEVDRVGSVSFNGWESLSGLDVLLATCAAFPLVTAAAVALGAASGSDKRERERRAMSAGGVVSGLHALISAVAFVLLILRFQQELTADEFIEVSRAYGIWIALLCAAGVMTGAWRASRGFRDDPGDERPAEFAADATEPSGDDDAEPPRSTSESVSRGGVILPAGVQLDEPAKTADEAGTGASNPALDATMAELPEAGFRRGFYEAAGKKEKFRRDFEGAYRRAVVKRARRLAGSVEGKVGYAGDDEAGELAEIVDAARKAAPEDVVLSGFALSAYVSEEGELRLPYDAVRRLTDQIASALAPRS